MQDCNHFIQHQSCAYKYGCERQECGDLKLN